MKYIKKYNESSNIHDICKEYGIKNYIINPDNSIDVDGSVDLYYMNIGKIPLNFNKVKGNFSCSTNELTSLEGAPKYVGGIFYCNNNDLISLKHGPKYVGQHFHCTGNELKSFEGVAKEIGGNFVCSNNPIEYLYYEYIRKSHNIELFNEYQIVKGDKLYLKRLMDYIKMNDYAEPNIKHLKELGYIIV